MYTYHTVLNKNAGICIRSLDPDPLSSMEGGLGLRLVLIIFCVEFVLKFILEPYPSARNKERGQEAVQQLQGEGLSPEFLPLDVDSEKSIQAAREEVQRKYGRIDVLVNNAGVLFRVRST